MEISDFLTTMFFMLIREIVWSLCAVGRIRKVTNFSAASFEFNWSFESSFSIYSRTGVVSQVFEYLGLG